MRASQPYSPAHALPPCPDQRRSGAPARQFVRYLVGTAIRPRRTFAAIVADPHGLAHGLAALALTGGLYTLTIAGLAAARAEISTPASLPIPADQYYAWQVVFALPVFLVSWLLAGWLACRLSRPFGGTGAGQAMLAALGLALAIPSVVTWLPETLLTLALLAGTTTQAAWQATITRSPLLAAAVVAYQLAAVVWYLALVSMAVAVARGLRWRAAAVVGTACVLLVTAIALLVIR